MMQMGQLGRISVHKLLYDYNEESKHTHPQQSWNKDMDIKIIDYDFESKRSKRTENPIESEEDSHTLQKRHKSEGKEDNLGNSIHPLTLLSNVAMCMVGKKSPFSSQDTEEELSDSDTVSVTREDDYIPHNNKERSKEHSQKLKAGQHHSKRRHRTSPEQLQKLEMTYAKEKMPNQELRESLARELGMTPRRVQIWFQNKRAKEKRTKHSESQTSPRHSGSEISSLDSSPRSSSESSLGPLLPTVPLFYPMTKPMDSKIPPIYDPTMQGKLIPSVHHHPIATYQRWQQPFM